MADDISREPMLDMFIFETIQLVEQLEQLVLDGEKVNGIETSINEIFRIMHTIKGSSAMMLFNNISTLAHSVEDIFYYLRENKPTGVDYSKLTDIVLESVDFFKAEVSKIEAGGKADGDASALIDIVKNYLLLLKPEEELENRKQEDISKQKYYISSSAASPDTKKIKYKAVIFFEDECEMENIRAFGIVHKISEVAMDIEHFPKEIIENDACIEIIKNEGFSIVFKTELPIEDIRSIIESTLFLKELRLDEINEDNNDININCKKEIVLDEPNVSRNSLIEKAEPSKEVIPVNNKQNYISVNVNKMDMLMDLVGELVIAEAMVTQNNDIKGLTLENFNKAARQLRKITSELQDIVMSVRMVPLSMTFQKMNRIVRDMSKKLNKDVQLDIIGEETEVDKNIIEHISDPLMHLIRNSIDHGLENTEERKSIGKQSAGRITLEAKNAGGDVWIIVRDDGRGLNKEKILKKARDNGLIFKPESELTDKDIYSIVLLPGFSTKESVSEFSGRGVGMDVVTKNIESVGGNVLIDSTPGEGTTVFIKIPLTLAIVDGMIIKVGNATYTVPTISVKESFRIQEEDIIKDTENNEMILVRGECYPILRLHELYKVKNAEVKLDEGILMMVEDGKKSICLFADALVGEQQVVIKALPKYIKKVKGIAGCTLLGDGSISLILDIGGLIS